jgi:hypothetical protein
MLLLIDTRIPPEPPPGRGRRRFPRPDPRVAWRLVAAVALLGAAAATGGLVGAVLALAGLIAICSAATTALPYGYGITQHRQ